MHQKRSGLTAALENLKSYKMNTFKRLTKKKLAKMYGVSYNTFMKWLSAIPELKLPKYSSLNPKQIKSIIEYLGEP